MIKFMHVTTVLSLFLLLAIPACDNEQILKPVDAGFDDYTEIMQGEQAGGVVVKNYTSVGEAFPCFIGPDPEDFRMQGFADITLDGDEYTMLTTINILESISPDHSQGAQVLKTEHLFQVFPEGFELPDPVFLGPCLDYESIVGESAADVMVTLDRSVASPGPEPFVFKLNAFLSPQEGSGIFEGVRSSPPIAGTNGVIEFDLIDEITGVIPVRAEWDVDDMIAFDN